MLRRSIKAICESVGIGVLDEVDTRQELLTRLVKGRYTHLVLDLTLADGDVLQILRSICREYPSLQIMVFSSRPAFWYRELLKEEYAIHYYISKSEPEPETIRQLLDFLENKKPKKDTSSQSTKSPFSVLSAREKEVLTSLLLGSSSKQISEELDISPETVRGYKKRILEKMNAATILELKNLSRRFDME